MSQNDAICLVNLVKSAPDGLSKLNLKILVMLQIFEAIAKGYAVDAKDLATIALSLREI